MAGHSYRVVDVFAGEEARGNPAGVVVLDAAMEGAAMQAQAARLGLPATAFVQADKRDGAHDICWFAPTREIALCGHGSLAAGHVLLGSGEGASTMLRAPDGRQLEVCRLEGGIAFELALPAIASEPRQSPELCEALGALPGEVRWNDAGYALAVFDDASAVRALKPDFAAIRQLGDWQVTATAASDRRGFDILSRVFSGEGEDSATGSAHAVLASYWCPRLGRDEISAYQASERGGLLSCRFEGERVWIGGKVREGAC